MCVFGSSSSGDSVRVKEYLTTVDEHSVLVEGEYSLGKWGVLLWCVWIKDKKTTLLNSI